MGRCLTCNAPRVYKDVVNCNICREKEKNKQLLRSPYKEAGLNVHTLIADKISRKKYGTIPQASEKHSTNIQVEDNPTLDEEI